MARQPENPQENLIALITKHQATLHACILRLVPNPSQADDIFQEANRVLWRKSAEYDSARYIKVIGRSHYRLTDRPVDNPNEGGGLNEIRVFAP